MSRLGWLGAYRLEQRAKKDKLVNEVIARFEKHEPSAQEIADYYSELKKLSLRDLKHVLEAPERLDDKVKLLERLKGLDKRKRFVVTMLNRNNTVSHYVVSKSSRVFTIKKKTYFFDSKSARFNTTYNMLGLIYHEDITSPLSIEIEEGVLQKLKVDAEAFRQVVKMEYAEMLANVSKVKDLIKFAVVFGGIASLEGLVIIVILVNQFNLI